MKVVTFGEIMLRLAPEGYLRFVQADKLGATFGGGEANVAVSLSNFGVDAAFVTKLPAHEIGQAAVNFLRKYGVDVGDIKRGGERVGIYYLEKGASQRPSKVIYDRAGSAFVLSRAADYDWNKIFAGADWFHFSGITPALGDNVAAICLEACKVARAKRVKVSCDLNYRSALWSREKAGKVMSEFMPYVNCLIANEGSAKDVFGIVPSADAGNDDKARLVSVAEQLVARFAFEEVALTQRESISASDNHWSGMFFTGGKAECSRKYAMHIVDRVGGGDSFAAGLIYARLHGFTARHTIEFAVAASCLKHSIEGDCNLVCADEVETLVGGDGSGRVRR